MTWRPPEPGTASSVHVEREVTGWLADQEPGASLYRWGLLLGSSFGDAITVSAVIPVQNRAQLDSEMAVRHAAPVVGICAWGRASDEREQLRLFEELFPEAGSVLLFAQAAHKKTAEVHVYFQDGRRDSLRPSRSIPWRTALTWTVAVLAVVLGTWFLFRDKEQEVSAPMQSQTDTAPAPAAEQPKVNALPSDRGADPATPTAGSAQRRTPTEGSRSKAPGRRSDRSRGSDHTRARFVEQDYTRERTKGHKWARPFAWVRDSTWKPASEGWSRLSRR